MNKLSTFFLVIAIAISLKIFAQDTLVQWTFPIESAFADAGIIPENLNMEIETAGNTGAVQFKNGATTKAAQADGWHSGANEKKWRVDLITTGFTNIRLSSKMTSGGQKPGPRDWKIQYRTDGSWVDVPDSEFMVANDWETGVVTDLLLPQECSDQQLLKLRWIMTSDTAHDGSIVAETGISKIDDIFVTGDLLDEIPEKEDMDIIIYPNPATDYLIIKSTGKVLCNVVDCRGQIIDRIELLGEFKLHIDSYKSGLYFLIIETEKKLTSIRKFDVKYT